MTRAGFTRSIEPPCRGSCPSVLRGRAVLAGLLAGSTAAAAPTSRQRLRRRAVQPEGDGVRAGRDAVRRRIGPAGERDRAAARQLRRLRPDRHARRASRRSPRRRPRPAVASPACRTSACTAASRCSARPRSPSTGAAVRGRGRPHDRVAEALVGRRPAASSRTVADVGEFNNDHPPPPQNGDAVPLAATRTTWSASARSSTSATATTTECIEATPLTGGLRILRHLLPGSDDGRDGGRPRPEGDLRCPVRQRAVPAGLRVHHRRHAGGQGAEGGHGPDDADRHGLREGRDAVRPPVRGEVRLRRTSATSPTPGGLSGSRRTARSTRS